MKGLIIFVGMVAVLLIGRSLFIPLLLAVFFWYLMNAIASYYRKIMPLRETLGAKIAAGGLSVATCLGLVYMFVTQISPTFSAFAQRLPDIQEKLRALAMYLNGEYGINLGAINLPSITDVATSVGGTIASIATSLGLVLIYVLFMFIEQSTFKKKFANLFKNSRQMKKMSFILESIDTNMKKYMFVKTFISVSTAVVSYFWMVHFGLEFAGVWSFLIFILNYIPTFGSIAATILPVLYSLITSESLFAPIMIAIGLIVLQILFSNILEPKLTGKTLNLSTLAILINLVFWGMLWGVVGAFFSVPMLVATFVITAQFDRTRWIAVLLSANGEIPEKEE